MDLTVNFSDSVTVDTAGGSPRIALTIGSATRYADFMAGSGTSALVFRYAVNAGDQDLNGIAVDAINVNGGTIASAAGGTAADLTLNNVGSTSGVLVDAVAPTVTSSTVIGGPGPDAAAVDFEVTFSEQVDGVDASDFTLTRTGSATGTIAFIATDDFLVYDVTVTDISGVGSLRLDALNDGSITDLAGNFLAAPYEGTPWMRSGSANADLSDLVPSVGALVPTFDPATVDYDIAVDNATDSITLTPTAAEDNATITVAGQAVASGGASQPIALVVGKTPIPIIVTAEDGTTQTYTVMVTRAASAVATLSSLVPSEGALDPNFAPATTSYAVAVDHTVETMTLAATAADANATITVNGQTVASGSPSQTISLPIGATDIDVVVTAEDGVTTQAYAVTVARSEIPTTLTLAQSAETSHAGDTITFTAALSGAINPNGVVIFTIGEVDHSVALSGNEASLEISDLAVGSHTIAARYEGDSYGNAESSATSITHTVEALIPPVAQNHTLEVLAGTSGSLDLTQGATEGPFTGSAIVSHPAIEAGEGRIEREGDAHMLHFAAAGSFAGTVSLSYTLSNADGTSEPAIVTITVVARPDPSLDPEVSGLVRAQGEQARRFANTQITNFNQRLEQLHDEGERRSNSIGVNVSVQQPVNNANAYAPEENNPQDPALGAIGQAAPAGQHNAGSDPQPAPVEELFGDLAFWSGGYVNFGTNDAGAINLDHTLVGVSAGVDYRFTPELTAGFGLGYGRDVTDVGNNGTESRAEAYSMALYGSYRPIEGVFIDGLAGYSAMSFDSLRFVTASGDIASGSRSGDQLFASLTAGYEYRRDGLLISPYGRLSGSHSTLDAFTETGAGMWNLTYGEQTIDTLSGTLGLRFAYDIPTDWGTLTPRGRIEYTHDFEGASRASLGYADLGTMPYELDTEDFSRDHVSLGLGIEAQIGDGWTLGFDYSTAFGTNGDSQDHTFDLQLGVRF